LLAIYTDQQIPVGVILDQGRCFGMINIQTLCDDLFLVIFALKQLSATFATYTGLGRRTKGAVIDCRTPTAEEAPCGTLDDSGIPDLNAESHDIRVGPEGFLQGCCLGNGARKAIQEIADLAIGLRNPVEEHLNDEGIRNKATGVHELTSLVPEGCVVLEVLSKEVPG